MTENIIWDRFANFDNFLLAWQRTVNNSSRMVSDDLGLRIFGYNLDANLRDLVRQVSADDFPYNPLADHKVYVPKPSTTLRTMSLLSIPDLIVYQALVNVIADQAHPFLVTHENQHVLGNLYSGTGRRWMLQPWKRQYMRFVGRIEKLYFAGNPWIASTDVVAFYDTIDHERLFHLVSRYCDNDPKFLELFKKCLAIWSAHNGTTAMSRGIPQGSNASDFLANLFLFDIDREMIVHGYHYVRYVDDVRILGPDKPTVQRGLILFDLELKRAGLVAQVSKTSVHQIENIEREVSRLRFYITDTTGIGDYVLVTIPTNPKSEQAESVKEFLGQTAKDQLDEQLDDAGEEETSNSDDNWDNDTAAGRSVLEAEASTNSLQVHLKEKFIESVDLLDDPERSKEGESSLTFCLYRLEPDEEVCCLVIPLLHRLPWRSEAITGYLSRNKNNDVVVDALERFVTEHDVYSWHRANALWALYEVSGYKRIVSICREWLSNHQVDWYARTVAAKILAEAPGQHAFLMECMLREQTTKKEAPEETAILRQQLAYGAFQRVKSLKKQQALFRLICTDRSILVRRLAVYLLQLPECKITWDELKPFHTQLSNFSELIMSIGISADAPRSCFISQTLSTMYSVRLEADDLRPFYNSHYDRAVEQLRDSVSAYHKSPSSYISSFHQFVHLTLIAFYQHVLPSESGLFEGYANLTNRSALANCLPRGINTWKRLGPMRNRVDHPIDRNTKTHSKKITVKEVEDIYRELQVSLQEMFDIWLSCRPPTVAPPLLT